MIRQSSISDLNLRSIFESISESVLLIDKDGIIISFNSKMKENVFQITHNELKTGKSVFDYILISGKPFFREMIDKVLTGKTIQYGHRCEKRSGEEVRFHLSINPVYDSSMITGICITSRDITERSNAQDKLKKSEQNYKTLFENNPLPIWIYDLETYQFLEVNKAAVRMYGYSRKEFLSMTLMDIRYENSLEELETHLTNIKFQNVISCDCWEHVTKNGDVKYVEISAMPLDYHNKKARLVLINDITQKITAVEQIKNSDQRYRTLFEQNLAGVYQSRIDGVILNCNDAFAKMLKYDTPDEILMINAFDLYFSKAERNDIISNVIKQKKLYNIEGVLKCKDGSPLYFLENMSLQADSVTGEQSCNGILIDITERKLAELKLIESNERFINVSKVTFDVVWDWNVHNKQLYLGDGFKELFGYDLNNEKIDFSEWAKHIHPEDKERVIQSRLNKIIHHDQLSWQDEYRYICKDGSVACVSDRGILLRNELGTYRMIGAMQDVTLLKEKETAITNLNRSLRKRAEELFASNTELERYAYVTSHDLQEPLRMVTDFLQLLQKKYKGQLDDTAQKYINFAVDGAGRMKTLILDLLEFSRISTGDKNHTDINLNDIITKTRETFKMVIDETGAQLNAVNLPSVCGNESQLLQLFQNLIGNALKYKSGVEPVIEISYTETELEWQFCVKDNGIGIDRKFFEKIFIIFQRLHNRTEYKGTGIGLAICKKIVELHGGKIWVESSKEDGSRFYFSILKLQSSGNRDEKMLSREIPATPIINTI